MTFIALTMTQVALLTFLTIITVILLFFLKLRQRRAVVASSILWQRVLKDREKQSFVSTMKKWLSLFLALTIALLLALSISRPHIEALLGPNQPVIIVLDSSMTMGTRMLNGQTRWQKAVEEGKKILKNHNTSSGFIAADTSGQVHTALTESRNEISNALDLMTPLGTDFEFPDVPSLGTVLYFISDGVTPIKVPDSTHVVSVFEPADNVAITAFAIQADATSPSGYLAHLEVSNYSQGIKNVSILISGVNNQRLARSVVIEQGASWKDQFNLSDFEGGAIRATIEADNDALAIDDTAYSYLPLRSHTRVTLVSGGKNRYLEALLRMSPRIDLNIVQPADFVERPDTDIYVFDNFLPTTEPSRPTLIFGQLHVNWLSTQIAIDNRPSIESWDSGHPVMQFVSLHDVTVDIASRVDQNEGIVLASSNTGPLIIAMEAPKQIIHVMFNLDSTDFPFQVSFPVFIQNVIQWFSNEELAEQNGLGLLELPIKAETVTRLDGSTPNTDVRFGQTVVEVSEPGLLAAKGNGKRIRIAANLADQRISNINQSEFSVANTSAAQTSASHRNELWFYMLLFALILVTIEWWTYHRRITL